MESITDLRAKVQAPVAKYNDVAGYLLGDRISIHVTRLFITMGWSPTVATLSMLAFGLAGSVLIPFDGVYAVVGFALVFAYYICDCVDGEVARYHHREKLIWGFHDFLFHLYVKSAFFVCLGIYGARFSGHAWVFFFGLGALLASLFQKFLQDLSLILTTRYVLLRGREENEHFVRQLLAEPAASPSSIAASEPEPYTPRGFLPFVRAALTNFDLAVVLFGIAALADLFVQPFEIYTLHGNCKIALLLFYGVVIPLDYFDHLVTHLRTERFRRDAARLLRRADQFRIDR